uniref:NTF2 domain-containing protein n=1 Tax=Glossina austeni TaxID=7395 RepID=A0A1A9UFA2_GLOAU
MSKPKDLSRRGYNSKRVSRTLRFSSRKDYENDNNNRDDVMRKKECSSTGRISFNKLQLKGSIKNRLTERAIRTRLKDDEPTISTFNERTRGLRHKSCTMPKRKFGETSKLTPSTLGWYRVMIEFTRRYSKDDVIHALHNAIFPEIFIPHYWRTEKSYVEFFVHEYSIAQRLQSVERNVEMDDGYCLSMRVRGKCPAVSIDREFKERMQLVMAKRYNPHTKLLDLSKFHADADFRTIFCGLLHPQVMSAALDIIEKHTPDLEALNLNQNHLSELDSFENVEQRLPYLKIIYLADNNIACLARLMVLRNALVTELDLKANPLLQRYKDHSSYVAAVREKFPKLVKLDGEKLEPRILFDVSDIYALPRAKALFLCDTSGGNIICQFLEQYFKIFDSDNRQPLLDAYHGQAMMSISVPSASQVGRLESFWKFNRNLRRIVNNGEINRIRQLKVGRLAVVSTLAEWPRTQHDPQSFTVDVTIFTPNMICFTVGGLFKEFESANNTAGGVRYFQRQFILVPAGNGFCIRNEMIFVTRANRSQTRTFLKPQETLPLMGAFVTPTATTEIIGVQNELQMDHQDATSSAAPDQPDDATKMQMVQVMSAQSHMNMEWSTKCLEENNWNYSHAIFIFDNLQKTDNVPSEAFAEQVFRSFDGQPIQ